MTMERTQTLEAYNRAWTESSEVEIRARLQECWTADSTYLNPFTDVVRGVQGLTRLIMDYPVIFPDAAMAPTSEPDVHHAFARPPWRLSSTAPIRILGSDFGHTMHGMDLVEFDANDKIKRVVSVLGCR
jgi:hypothetical protein